jgi:hypothetical protein
MSRQQIQKFLDNCFALYFQLVPTVYQTAVPGCSSLVSAFCSCRSPSGHDTSLLETSSPKLDSNKLVIRQVIYVMTQ